MTETSTTRIDILRHGLPEGDGCLRGHTDFPITAEGLEQMHAAVYGLLDVEQVLSSPLQRCHNFAKQFASQRSLPIEQYPDWKEMNFGRWDGQSRDSLWQTERELLSGYWKKNRGNPLRMAASHYTNLTVVFIVPGKRCWFVIRASVYCW